MRSEGYSTQFVCLSVSLLPSLTAAPLRYRYKGRYESKANAVLKVFDAWISLKILCSKDTVLFAHTMASRYIRTLATIGRLAAISNTITYDD